MDRAAPEVGIDWLSVTGPEGRFRDVLNLLAELAEADPETTNGRHFYARGWRFPNGARLFDGHASGTWFADLSGGVCAQIDAKRLHALGGQLLAGGRCTRIDLRADLRGRMIALIWLVIEACRAGELCRVRRFKIFEELDAATQQLAGHGVYLGSSKSPAFVRVYDKGLEQGEEVPGRWVRFEAQLRDHHAREAGVAIFTADPDEWETAAFSRLAGVVDFRELGGDGHLDRRPRLDWWADFLEGVSTTRARCPARDPDGERSLAWMARTSAAMIAAAAEEAGTDSLTAFALLLGHVQPSESAQKNPATYQIAKKLRSLLRAGYDRGTLVEDSSECR